MAAPTIQPGTVLGGTFRIVRPIGHGGMGEVYEATHRRLAGRYAVKFIVEDAARDAEAFKRFRREAEITSGLQHPNIVQVIDFDRTPDGVPYMVMELLKGCDLAAELRNHGPMPVRAAVPIVRQVSSALAAAHEHGVVHRDLTPRNIFLIPVAGQPVKFVKVLDFGISKVKDATQSITGTGTFIGTPGYVSPEQARGLDEIDGRTDQFALACIAYEMVVGRPPFSGPDKLAIIYQIIHEPARFPPDSFTPEEIAVLRRALSKKASDRYASIVDFVDALAALTDSDSLTRFDVNAFASTARGASPTAGSEAPGSSTQTTAPHFARIVTTLSSGAGESVGGRRGWAPLVNAWRFVQSLARKRRWAVAAASVATAATALLAFVLSSSPGPGVPGPVGRGPPPTHAGTKSPSAGPTLVPAPAPSPSPSPTSTLASSVEEPQVASPSKTRPPGRQVRDQNQKRRPASGAASHSPGRSTNTAGGPTRGSEASALNPPPKSDECRRREDRWLAHHRSGMSAEEALTLGRSVLQCFTSEEGGIVHADAFCVRLRPYGAVAYKDCKASIDTGTPQ